MASFGRFIMQRTRAAKGMHIIDPTKESQQEPREASTFDSPTPRNILEVKRIFSKSYKLPIEIIDTIIDFAEYWPRTTVRTLGPKVAGGRHEDTFVIRSLPLGYHSEISDCALPIDEYLAAPCKPRVFDDTDSIKTTTSELFDQWTKHTVPRLEHPCRKIIFTIRSKDQGWGGEPSKEPGNKYWGSYTWFDAGLERIEAAVVKDDLSRATRATVIPADRLRDYPAPLSYNSDDSDGLVSDDEEDQDTSANQHEAGIREPDTNSEGPSEIFVEQIHLTPGPNSTANLGTIACDLRPILPSVRPHPSNRFSKFEFEHPLNPPPTHLQSNVTASRVEKTHIITWSYDDCINPDSPEGEALEKQGRGKASATGEYVRNLKIGDIVTVWARARYGGWVNEVKSVRVDVYWAV